jgi:hypothetical protein
VDVAIDFDGQRLFVAVEVEYERAHGMLSSELAAPKAVISKHLPEDCLRLRRFPTCVSRRLPHSG